MARGLSLFNRIIGGLVLLVVFLLLSVWAFSPMIVRHYAPQFLDPLNLKITPETHVRLNPFKLALSISELGLHSKEHEAPQATIKDGLIDLNALALMQNTLAFDELDFAVLALDIERSEQLTIAGYTIDESAAPEDMPPAEKSTSSPAQMWTLSIPGLSIEDFTINLIDEGNAHAVHLEELKVSQLGLSENFLNGALKLTAKLNEAPFSAEVDIDFTNQLGEINFATRLEAFPMAPLAYLAESQTSTLRGGLGFALKGVVIRQPDATVVSLSDSMLQVDALDLQLADLEVRESSVKLEAEQLNININDSGAIQIDGKAALNGQALEIGPSRSRDVLLALDTISLPSNEFTFSDDAGFEIAIEVLDAAGLRYSHKGAARNLSANNEESEAPANSKPALVALDDLRINQIMARSESISIESIELGKLLANAQIDAQQQIENLVMLGSADEEQDAEPANPETENTSEEQTAEKPYGFALGRFNLREAGLLNFSYQGMEPPFRQTLTLKTLSLEKLDSGKPMEFSKLILEATAGEYTSIKANGDIAPFAEHINMTLNLEIREFELPKISPFIRTAAGFDMANGQLDSDTQIAIVNDEISGEAKIEIRGLEVDNAGDVHTGSLAEQTFIPLNVALSALEDSDGRIELDVPLRGNVTSPDFGLNGFLNLVAQRAALAASKSYLINTFVPYANIVTLTTIAGSYALKPRVDDLLFAAGIVDLSVDHKEFLDKLAALLNDKKSTDMRVCGFSVITEEEAVDDGLSPEQTQNLRDLALGRATNVKSYLVQNHAIASSRVLLCEAKIDQREDASPRVVFEF